MCDGIDSSFLGKYEVNKLGQFRIKDTKRILTPVDNPNLVDYPKIILRSKIIKEKRYAIHRLLAITFLVNDDPNNKIEVDHINRDCFDYSLINLRWVSSSENKKNRTLSKENNENYYLLINNDKIIGTSLEKIKNSTKVSKDTYDFYNSRLEILSNEIWKKHPVLDITVSSFGVIRTKSGKYTIGKTIKSGYKTVTIEKKVKRVHSLVAETFIVNRPL